MLLSAEIYIKCNVTEVPDPKITTAWKKWFRFIKTQNLPHWVSVKHTLYIFHGRNIHCYLVFFIGYPNLNLGRYATSIFGNFDFLSCGGWSSSWNHSYKVNFGGVLFDFTKYQKLVCKIRGRKFRYRSTQNLGEYIQMRIQNDVGVLVHCVYRCHTATGP